MDAGHSEGMEHSRRREERRAGGHGTSRLCGAKWEEVAKTDNWKIQLQSRALNLSPISRRDESALSELVFINVRSAAASLVHPPTRFGGGVICILFNQT